MRETPTLDRSPAADARHATTPAEGRRAAGRDEQRAGRLSSAHLIGRERELALLLEALDDPPAVILVEGEAGIGKSRLVHEALCHPAAATRSAFVGHCHRLREPFLLGPVVEALRGAARQPPSRPLNPVVGALRPLLPELADSLPVQPAPVGDGRAERHRTFRALRELMGALGPTVCVLEDLHWADEGTLEFLDFLLAEPPQHLSLVLTYRREDLSRSSRLLGLATGCKDVLTATVEVCPLEAEELRSLTCAILGRDGIPDELATYLHKRTAGIPFALEEVLRLLGDRGTLDFGDRGRTRAELDEVGVPPAVQESIRERMEPFTDDARLMTRAAAVLGMAAGEDLIMSVAGLAPARAASGLTEALVSGLVVEQPGGYGLRHALAAQAVYEAILGPERHRLHLRAGRALASQPEPRPLALLAHHFREADRPRQWARYAEQAADMASSLGDDRAAAELLEQALTAPGLRRAARIRMTVKLGSAAVYGDRPETAIDLLEHILDDEPMPVGVRGELRFRLARLRFNVGNDVGWHDEMVQAVTELRHRPELAARAMVNLAWPVLREGSVGDDLAWLPKATGAAALSHDPVTETVVCAQRAAILLSVGDPEGWRALEKIRLGERSVEEKLELLHAYHSLSVVTLGLGHYRRAEAFLAEVGRLDDELGGVWWDPWSASVRASLDWRIGRWDELESRLGKLAQSGSPRPVLAVGNDLILGSLVFCRGRVEEAERRFEAIQERAHARRWMSARVTASAWLARIRLSRGDSEAAARIAVLGLETLKRKGIWLWGRELVPVAVQALLACGQQTSAGHLAREFARGLVGRDAPAAHGASLFCQGLVAEAEAGHQAAARFFARADGAWSELPSPYEAAQARERRARCLLATDSDQGAALLLGALQAFGDLQATGDIGRVRAELKAQGIAPPSRGGRRAYGNELSPREDEVARLAGSGLKNREIADILFVSPRTVEAHVASAMRKLSVDSRHALTTPERNGAEKAAALGKNT
ncbi:MAG: AAA family ATPase [Thermoleophilaceae bacterium]